MKKRLMCLILCLVMLLSAVLTACSKKTDEDEPGDVTAEASATAKTLTMWIVSKENVTEATALSVTEELNKITRARFKTELVITFLTEDKYRSELEKVIKAREQQVMTETTAGKDTEADETTKREETTALTDETMTNTLGLTVIKYPELEPNQVDIVYITGEDMYMSFIDNGWLAGLDTELNVSSKKIMEYVSPTLLSAAKVDGTTYAIPNNRTIGEYKYMLLDKELMDKYSMQGCIQTNAIDGFHNEYVYAFLDVVAKNESATTVPIGTSYDECLSMLAHYWSFDKTDYDALNTFSLFGYHYKDISEINRGSVALGFNSLFEDEKFTEQYLKLNQFKFDGYYMSDDTADKNAAIKFVNGDYSLLNEANNDGYCTYQGEKYYVVPVGYPAASSKDIYDHMFGVCSYSKELSRAMQIITYINTNSDFRNILQYGKEGTNYRLNRDEDTKKITLERLNNDYMMDIFATGNAFIAHPEPTMSPNIWESGKVQNRYSQVNPLLGFNLTDYAEKLGTVEETISIGKDGYTISHTTGYTKYAFSQNETLAAWLAKCDKAGNGVYVLESSYVSGQNLIADYYVYNKGLTKKSAFTVEVQRDMETVVDEKTGKESQVQTNLDFVLNYTDTGAASETGYELSIVTLYTKKNNEFEFLAKQNNATAVKPEIAKAETLVTVDVMNSPQYSIEAYEDLTKSALRDNVALTDWIKECDLNWKKEISKIVGTNGTIDLSIDTSKTYVNYFTSADGTETTYVIYRTGLTYVTDYEFMPTGDTGKLDLRFCYKDDGESLLELNPTGTDLPERNYYLSYIRVKELEDIELTVTIDVNGTEETVTPVAFSADPDFDMVGNLDTELIKFLSDLNTAMIEKLNACTDMTSLEILVKDLGTLLSTEETAPKITALDRASGFREFVNNNYTVSSSLESFHNKILRATSPEIVKNMIYDTSAGAAIGSMIEDTYKDALGTKEAYVYYESPYCIYYTWMETYGYLPK